MKKRVNVPLVLQMENVECGAASLAMVLRYFGKKSISLEQLRTDCNVSRDGVTAKGIKRAAIKNGLICNAYKASPESIKKISFPSVIHWNMGHFVVLCGYGKNCYYINDPAIGRYSVSSAEFDRSFTGIVLTFEKSEKFTDERGNKNYMSFTFKSIKPFIPKMIFLSFVLMTVTVFNMVLPFFNSVYIDNIILTGNTSGFLVLEISMVMVIAVLFISSALGAKMNYEIERHININLSIGFMKKILRLPIVFFSQRTPGELSNRQIGSFEIAQLIVSYIIPVLFQAVLIIIYCIAAFVFNVYVALIGIGAIILNIAAVIYSSGKMNGLSALSRKNTGLYQSNVASAVDMIETIKSCACEDAVFARLAGTSALNIEAEEKTDKIKVYSSAIFYFINLIVSASILILGAYEILTGEFSVGTAVGVMGMISAFLMPVGSFVNSISTIFNLKSISERTNDTMKYRDEEIFLSDDEKQTKVMDGSVRAENVSYRYGNEGDYAIKNISFDLEKGKSIAFAGGSGSGKSTAAKVIAGLFYENKGHIFYGNAEKKELKKAYFYSKVAVVSQSVKLYDGTVFDNITMWDKSVSYDDVVLACKKACIHDDIVMRKGAYYEKITEGGKNFSGGQRQRFEIARAIVRKPEILILDEATSALDAETEKMVMENIKSLGITLIIIAHRLSTIRNCDEILVFNNGEIVERGNNDKLIEQKDFYYKLVSDMGE